MFDLRKVVFSAPGSYVGISQEKDSKGGGVWARCLISPEWGTGRKKISSNILKLMPFDGKAFVNYFVDFQPSYLKLVVSGTKYIKFVIESASSIKVELKNCGLVFEHDNEDLFAADCKLSKNNFSAYYPLSNVSFSISAKNGKLQYLKQNNRIVLEKSTEARVEIKRNDISYGNFEKFSEEKLRTSFERFVSFNSATDFHSTLSSYILWSGSFMPLGNIQRWVNPISKLKMNMFFSLANCFLSLGHAQIDKKLARSNFLALLDFQKDNGYIYDAVNPVLKVLWFTKPPIYGYIFEKLLDKGVTFTKEEELKILEMFVKLFNAWMKDSGKIKLCRYTHPWDSGMDNATCFDEVMPLSTPELNAYVITLLDAIVHLCEKYGLEEDASKFSKISKSYLKHFLKLSWNGIEFTALTEEGKRISIMSTCKFIPFILGEKLPKEIVEKMSEDFENGGYLTEWSIASESVYSVKYDSRQGDTLKPSAYWRGPIWPYFVYLITEGLCALGKHELAVDIRQRFCLVVEKNLDGIYENYDALSGVGYEDSCDQWTSALYLLMKNGGENE